MKILHVITALNVGGAETMLAKLVEHERAEAIDTPCVISLMPPGAAAIRMRASGTAVHDCGLTGATTLVPAIMRLRALVRQEKPDIVMAWMYHAHLASMLANGLQARRTPLIWNVRHSIDDLRQEKPAMRAVVRIAALLSRRTAMILYNSHAAARQHERLGFSAKRSLVVPNGFDCDLFRPRPGARELLAARLGTDPAALIVGMAARNHPMKDAANLVDAVKRARSAGIDIHLLLTGEGMDRPAGRLAQLIGELPRERVTLRGHDGSLPDLLPGLDLLVLPSAWGEGFPNILGEAMACGLPCIATDVGDSGWIIGDCGMVVPPRDPRRLAEALLAMSGLDRNGRQRLGREARERVKRNFSMDSIARAYAQVYQAARSGTLDPSDQPWHGAREPQVM
ncbi:glycosyltransferase [Sphingobium mellinum]|uniref:glycosyltransferase n=1 Tax=Sphingobium mellinum TaxID=1387166 RepID=UPI0030EF9D34